jgi:hypothetical protein
MSFFGSTNYYDQVARGKVAGERIVTVTGRNSDLSMTAPEIISDIGGDDTLPTSGETWELVSSDANDTSAGTGAQEITVTYLDDAWSEQSHVQATNGGTVVMSPTDIFRLLTISVTATGSGNKNAGDLTLQVSGGGTVRGKITGTLNKALHGLYTIPLGFTGYVIYGYGSVEKNQDATLGIFSTNGANNILAVRASIALYQNNFALVPSAPVGPLLEKTDLVPIAESNSNNTTIDLFYQIHLVAN